MASEFIGYNVIVTLKTPPNAQVQGTVANVAGQRLTLQNVTLLWSGQRLPTYHIDAPGIADLEVSNNQVLQSLPGHGSSVSGIPQCESYQQTYSTLSQRPYEVQSDQPIPVETAPQPVQQPFVDPAILSFSKPPAKQAPTNHVESSRTRSQNVSPAILPDTTTSGSSRVTQTFHSVSTTATTSQDAHRKDSTATATLTEPFSNLALDAGDRTAGKQDTSQEKELQGSVPEGRKDAAPLDAPMKYTGKRSRRGGRNKLQKDANFQPSALDEQDVASSTNPKAKGWRQTAFVEPMHPQSPSHANGKRRNQRSKKAYAEDLNGWATEDATDIQEMGDFDFQSNLSKFDKRRVFDQIRNDDTTADEERLVSFNRKVPRPGTNGGKNLHYTENVLDSPADTDEASDAKFSSGNFSGRDLSRTSTRAQNSRKGSGVLGQPLVPPQINSIGRSQLNRSRTASPRPSKQSVSASPMNGPTPSGTLRLTTTNRSCPTVSPLQMLEVEQLAVAELGLTEDIITENAGRDIAEAAVVQLSSESAAPTMLVLTGNHRTGARAVAAARHLRNRGHRVTLCMLGLEHENELLENCRKQLEIFKKIGGRVLRWEELSARLSTSDFAPDLVVDALFGMHIAFEDLRTDDQAAAFEMIAWVNRSKIDVLSVDIPSGVSASSGEVTLVEGERLCINSKFVVCLGAPKTGVMNALLSGEAQSWQLSVADIGIGQVVWRKYGTRRRHGVDFGNRWVVPLRYQPSAA
ncbi:hypothetical protein VTN00DRAFT_4112 [Thermoascus crustaceus]|uniref:uncharacterized protein n=1 Tax=Thermoascus crustaceus TaxID=5088 RepID=UPI0037447994